MDTGSDQPQPDADVGLGTVFKHEKFPNVKTVARINVGDECSDLVDALYMLRLYPSLSQSHTNHFNSLTASSTLIPHLV